MISRLKKSLACTIIGITIISSFTYADGNIPSEWAKVEIDKAKEMNLLPEKLQGEYRSSITREDFSELAVNLYEGLSGKETTLQKGNPFTDTQNEEVLIANNLGIVKGKGDGIFAPNNKITREEVSVMLYQTLKVAKPGYNYSGLYEHIFMDYYEISPWAREAVGYLYGVGVINGVGDNQFKPGRDTSREEAIILVKKLYDKVLASEMEKRSSLTVSRGIPSRQAALTKSKLENLISQEMGKPYQWGGTGPDGYDCSGLVYSIFGKLGILLPRDSKSQSNVGTYVSKEDLVYGDLVFFARDGKNINHVGIYVGNGEFVHSPETGDVVKITTLMSGYYDRGYHTARRVLP